MQTVAEVANLNFDQIPEDVQVSGKNATNGIGIYFLLVLLHRASRHAGTDIRNIKAGFAV